MTDRNLYVCTVYPFYPTEEMMFSLNVLDRVEGLNVIPIWVRAGQFSHRHPRSKPDPVQIQWRQQYLDAVPDGEWLLILDSDELIYGAIGRIPAWLDTLEGEYVTNLMDEADECLVAVVTEIKPNFELLKRPRLIRKREGMQYGKHTQKHDEIDYLGKNILGKEYKDYATLDHLSFLHYKNGRHMTLYSDKLRTEEEEEVRITSFEDVMKDYFSDKLTGETVR